MEATNHKNNKIIRLSDMGEDVIMNLIDIWEDSVRSTHTFITEKDIQTMRPLVRAGILKAEHLLAIEEGGALRAFMIVNAELVYMLFVDADSRGRGFGKQLMNYATGELKARYVNVNQQNHQAVGFYESLGFQTYKIDEYDGLGNHYPILYMELKVKQ